MKQLGQGLRQHITGCTVKSGPGAADEHSAGSTYVRGENRIKWACCSDGVMPEQMDTGAGWGPPIKELPP